MFFLRNTSLAGHFVFLLSFIHLAHLSSVEAAEVHNSSTPGIGSYVVTADDQITIVISGGEGGGGSSTRGGQGASVTGVFSLTTGDTIRYVVGAGSLSANGAGGAGSTGVFINNTLVMVAGGGGGGDNSTNAFGQGANSTTNGDSGTGGSAGAGGTAGAGGGSSTGAAGGGGINSAGANSGSVTSGQPADLDPSDGVTFVAGGAAGSDSSAGGGGFTSGGGAGPNYWPGGGGGYSGGGAGGSGGRSGGGGSFLNTSSSNYISGSMTAGADGASTGGSGVDGSDGSITINDTSVAPIGGLIGEWRFDELFWNGTNSEVIDASGNDLHLTAFSALTGSSDPAIAGDPGTCSYGVFNGSVSFIQLDDDTSTADSLLDISNNLTITTWINTNVIPTSGLKSILSKDENYEFHINSSGQIYWWWQWDTLTTTGPSLNTNQWYHIAITWRDGEQVIYIDGVERARSDEPGSLNINNDPLQVGQDLDIPERFFDGEIDEVRIYENFLNVTEINQIMNETRPCSSSGICTLTFEDSFNAAAYNNSTGSQPWASDWIENGDDGSASSGNVYISGGALQMNDNPNSGGQPNLERELNLNNFIDAFITLDLSTSGNLEDGDRFDIYASADGGATYSILSSFSNDFSGSYSYDLSSFMASNTRIRLRVENGYGGGTELVTIDNVSITGLRNCGPDHFAISHDGAGINCLPEAITIRAENADGSLVTDYAGTLNLSTITNNGNWTVTDNIGPSPDPALGTLSDTPGDNDGVATYQFVTGDGGSVVLYLQNTLAETTNIDISEGGVSDDNTEGDITFRPFGFVFSPSPITTQVAGRPFDLTLTAAGQTQDQAECAVIEEYDGVRSINFWSNYTDPIASPTQVSINSMNIATTEALSTAQDTTFSNGVATVEVQYDDSGQISIHAKDEIDIGEPPSGSTDEIIGGISPFVVRPFGFDIVIEDNPIVADGSGTVFRSADESFDMTLRSVLWQAEDDTDDDGYPDIIDTDSDGTIDIRADLSNNDITPNISNITSIVSINHNPLVVTVNNGLITTTSVNTNSFIAAGLTGEGTLTFAQSWNEVGILQLNAQNTDFMGGGQSVLGERINIGRFIPDHYIVEAPLLIEQCSVSFTYGGFYDGINAGLDRNGQTFEISGFVRAVNTSDTITQNYQGEFAKLTASDISATGFDTTNTTGASGRVNFASIPLSFSTGRANYSDLIVDYQFDNLIAPFDLRIDLSVVDSDSVTGSASGANSVELRLGRLRMRDTYGPETSTLEMTLFSEYFDGTNWIQNTDDSCTNYITTGTSFDLTSFTEQLNNGETAVTDPIAEQTFINGQSSLSNGLWFSPSGDGNYGSVLVEYDLTSQPWLAFDWNSDNSLNSPSATLSFGYYRGSDRVIYWREIRN